MFSLIISIIAIALVAALAIATVWYGTDIYEEQKIEAGAQGHHKIQRGYLPVPTWSVHWVANSSLRGALEEFLKKEKLAIDAEIQGLMRYSPYHQSAK